MTADSAIVFRELYPSTQSRYHHHLQQHLHCPQVPSSASPATKQRVDKQRRETGQIPKRRMLEEPDITSLLDALNTNRPLLARTRICLARLQKNPRRYHGRLEVNNARKIAYMINLTPGLARRLLEDPRFQDDDEDIGVMKKSERLLMVCFHTPRINYCNVPLLISV